MSFSVYAKDFNDVKGFNSWTVDEQNEYMRLKGRFIIGKLLGISEESEMERLLQKIRPYYETEGYSSLEDWLLAQLTYDDDENAFVPSTNMVTIINNVISEYKDDVTMVYRYPISPSRITADNFSNKAIYQAVVDLCKQCPDAYFWFPSREMNQSMGSGRFYIDGERIDFNYDHDDLRNGWIRLFAYDGVFAGVSSYPDLTSTPVSLYNEGWERIIDQKLFLIRAISSTEYQICYCSSLNDFYMITDLDSLDISNVPYIFHNWFIEDKVLYLNSKATVSFSSSVFYSASNQALNVYKSVADMKKDIGAQVIGKYDDNYTGQCATSIPSITINNYIPPGSGTGTGTGTGDGDGGSGSGGGFFDSVGQLFGTLGDGIAKIIEALIKPITAIIDMIVGLVDKLVGVFTNLLGSFSSDVPDFFAAVFKFLPEEVVSVMSSCLILALIVALFKFIRG